MLDLQKIQFCGLDPRIKRANVKDDEDTSPLESHPATAENPKVLQPKFEGVRLRASKGLKGLSFKKREPERSCISNGSSHDVAKFVRSMESQNVEYLR